MLIGILALQGAFLEHAKMLDRLGVPHCEIRNSGMLRPMDGLILPGGESTTMGKLLRDEGLFEEPLQSMIKSGLPVFGTCAGMILLAKKIDNDARTHFATMDVDVVRNAYGRQLGSFRTEAPMDGVDTIPMVFIRAALRLPGERHLAGACDRRRPYRRGARGNQALAPRSIPNYQKNCPYTDISSRSSSTTSSRNVHHHETQSIIIVRLASDKVRRRVFCRSWFITNFGTNAKIKNIKFCDLNRKVFTYLMYNY
ncbi:MAG: pyridoxal 5'-phosphate synthase glutaminase subunit PdxT [Bacillus subtilis]|nr:pyridoxal 5'-phosphate synthase glutaminase subunit PdxT [Bacillus subtilis]